MSSVPCTSEAPQSAGDGSWKPACRSRASPLSPTPSPGRAATRIFCLNHPPRLCSKQPTALVWASLHGVQREFFTPTSSLQTSDSHGEGTGVGCRAGVSKNLRVRKELGFSLPLNHSRLSATFFFSVPKYVRTCSSWDVWVLHLTRIASWYPNTQPHFTDELTENEADRSRSERSVFMYPFKEYRLNAY